MPVDSKKAELFTLKNNNGLKIEITNFGGKVILITNAKTVPSHKNILVLQIEEQDEYLFSIQSIIPIQLFIDTYTKLKGYEAGSFSHGAKVTEVE